MKPRLVLLGLLLGAAACSGAQAHQASDAYLQLSQGEGGLQLSTQVALRDVERELFLDANDDGQLSWGELRPHLPDIEAWVREGVQLRPAESGCALQPSGPTRLIRHGSETFVEVTQRWQCERPATVASLGYRLLRNTDASHRGLLTLGEAGAAQTHLLAPAEAELRLNLGASPDDDAASWARQAGFVRQGITHILEGWDHLAFLLVLVLPVLGQAAQAGAALRQMAWVVSSFTLAHSLTLSLAVLGWLRPPSDGVELGIALSVVIAALANLRLRPTRRPARMAFAFGLIHGFGFAGALQALGVAGAALWLPLLSFNLGVELGQGAVLAALTALVWPWRDSRVYHRLMLQTGSLLIAGLALVWSWQRMAPYFHPL